MDWSGDVHEFSVGAGNIQLVDGAGTCSDIKLAKLLYFRKRRPGVGMHPQLLTLKINNVTSEYVPRVQHLNKLAQLSGAIICPFYKRP